MSVRFPISLRIAGDDVRLAGPSLVLIRNDESWAVSDPGPFGRKGPIVGSPAPIRPEIDVPILIYHHVAPQLPGGGEDFNTVTTEAFARQLQWLADTGHVSISVAELFNAFYYDLPLPSKPVILVFDDGYADIYEHRVPAFARSRVPRDRGGDYRRDGPPRLPNLGPGAGDVRGRHRVRLAHREATGTSRRHRAKRLSRNSRIRGASSRRNSVCPCSSSYIRTASRSPQAHRRHARWCWRSFGNLATRALSPPPRDPPYISLQRADAPYLLHRIPVSGGESVERFAASIEGPRRPKPDCYACPLTIGLSSRSRGDGAKQAPGRRTEPVALDGFAGSHLDRCAEVRSVPDERVELAPLSTRVGRRGQLSEQRLVIGAARQRSRHLLWIDANERRSQAAFNHPAREQ